MKPRSGLPIADRRALLEAFDRACRDIPGVRDVRIGRRFTFGAGYEGGMPDTADYMIALAFDDAPALQAYLRHPAHQELGARWSQSLSSALVYDFEETRLEDLRTRESGDLGI
ncbi:MAG: Dabb family protein [Acidobacteria bacterium]|nr:Dabb family protein [Acidobacteriota bacterium]